jgi:hypothetical protein
MDRRERLLAIPAGLALLGWLPIARAGAQIE